MQTFLPYDDFVLSLDCLDYRRLGKQRVEAMQLLNAMKREKGGWINHPATKMWRGYEKKKCTKDMRTSNTKTKNNIRRQNR